MGAAPFPSRSIKFGVLSPQEIYQLSEFEVVTRELYQVPNREPTVNGCLDPRLVRGNERAPRRGGVLVHSPRAGPCLRR